MTTGLSCASRGAPASSEELARWAEGPVRWLLIPAETRLLRKVKSQAEAVSFIEAFWARRDSDPEGPNNPCRESFLQRVESADILYGEIGTRGSLTDRGRALILLGPASHLHVGSRPGLTWSSRTSPGEPKASRAVGVEKWGYRMEDLPPRLFELAADREKRSGKLISLTLSFVADGRRTRIEEGEELLELAALAAVRSES